MSDHVSVRMGLLDKQIVDSERLPFGRVDDLELGGDVPAVRAILVGSEALGERVDGAVGRWMARLSARLRPRSGPAGPTRIDPGLIAELEPFVELSVRFDELPHVAALERWLARNVVEPLPVAGDARE
jgi:hypothetical protein